MFWAPCGSGGGGGWGWVIGGGGWFGGGWGVGDWEWGWLGGVPHTCTHAHMHTHTHACDKHDNFMQMAASIGFLGNPWEFPMMSYAHTCVCAHVWGAPLTAPPPLSSHPPPPGETLRISQNSIVLELIKIFQFSLKIWNLWRLPHPWVGVWFGAWVDGWVGWWVGQIKTLKIVKILT